MKIFEPIKFLMSCTMLIGFSMQPIQLSVGNPNQNQLTHQNTSIHQNFILESVSQNYQGEQITISNASRIQQVGLLDIGSSSVVAWSPDGNQFAIGAENGIFLYNPSDMSLLKHIETPESVNQIIFSPDSKKIIIASRDYSYIRFLDSSTGVELYHSDSEISHVSDLAISTDGKYIVDTHALNGALWDGETGRFIRSYTNIDFCNTPSSGIMDTNGPVGIVFSDDGHKLALAFHDEISILDRSGQIEIMSIIDSAYSVQSIAISPNSEYLASGNAEGTITLWDLDSGDKLTVYGKDSNLDYIRHLVFSVDGSLLFSTDFGGTLKVWNITSEQELFSIQAHQNKINEVALSPDGTVIATSSPDGTVRLWGVPIAGSSYPQPRGGKTFREWFEYKNQLVNQLETTDIPTSLFALEDVKAYNEESVKDFLYYVQSDVKSGSITQNEEDAFIRFVLQEKTLAEILPIYSDVTAFQSDVIVDMAKIILTFNRGAEMLSGACEAEDNIGCAEIIIETRNMIAELITKLLLPACTNTFQDFYDQEYAAGACQVMIRSVRTYLDSGKSLEDFFIEEATKTILTKAFIQRYLNTSQDWLNIGLETADMRQNSENEWNITGGLDQAIFKTNDLVGKAKMHRDIAEIWYQSFQAGGKVLGIETDLMDIVGAIFTEPSVKLAFKLLGMGTRIANLTINIYELDSNGKEMACIRYLSSQANEIAFNAELMQKYCDMEASKTVDQIIPISNEIPKSNFTKNGQLEKLTNQYLKDLDKAEDSIRGMKYEALQRSLGEIITSKDSLYKELGRIYLLSTYSENEDQNQIELRRKISEFYTDNISLFLAIKFTSLSMV